jgi:transketolase
MGETMAYSFGPRRGVWLDIVDEMRGRPAPLSSDELTRFEAFDLIYRSLCPILFNYVPTSGHPGGSISSGRIVASLLFDAMDYDLSRPDREEADLISYSAGHKALGIYAMWALRDEVARVAAPGLLPADARQRLRLEDLLGFRRNPSTRAPLFLRFGAKALDGHPTPATPFLRLATGASGVGVGSSLGLAFGTRDYYGEGAPRVHVVEGEGGLTPGRVAEVVAATGTASVGNAFLHLDWNQSSIDSDRVCREGDAPGDYVQWDPCEFFHLHDWNVIRVPDGSDFQQVVAAQRRALALDNGQPTALVYRTTKGWQYGIEGRASHGAGHALCSAGFLESVAELTSRMGVTLPSCPAAERRCAGSDRATMEACFWEALGVVRSAVEEDMIMASALAARERLERRSPRPRGDAPRLEAVFDTVDRSGADTPGELALAPGTSTTLRAELGRALGYLNRASGGAVLAAAADLLGSTSVNLVGAGFPAGYWHARANPQARLLSIGGICEDGMAALLSGMAAYGRHLGVGSSYGAFMAPLGHIASRLHAIGQQARRAIAPDETYRPMILVCAHAGLKTGEDGPTHADPQALQLLQGNFPPGTLVTLTPWDPAEIWPLLAAALARRPAVIVPFVTRPTEKVPDRAALGLAPAAEAVNGVYRLRRARGRPDGALVIQESGAAYAFVEGALPRLEADGVDLDVYYVASEELFDALPAAERDLIFPDEVARVAMGITGFTLPTLYRWVRSARGRAMSMHAFQKGHFLGSGQAHQVIEEAGLDGSSQYEAVIRYVEGLRAPPLG